MQTAQLQTTSSHAVPRQARRQFARTANKLAARILSEPRSCRSQPVCASAREQVSTRRATSKLCCSYRQAIKRHAHCIGAISEAFGCSYRARRTPHADTEAARLLTVHCLLVPVQSQHLATDIVQKLPAASVAALVASLSLAQPNVAVAAEFYQPPSQSQTATQQVSERARRIEYRAHAPNHASKCWCWLLCKSSISVSNCVRFKTSSRHLRHLGCQACCSKSMVQGVWVSIESTSRPQSLMLHAVPLRRRSRRRWTSRATSR